MIDEHLVVAPGFIDLERLRSKLGTAHSKYTCEKEERMCCSLGREMRWMTSRTMKTL